MAYVDINCLWTSRSKPISSSLDLTVQLLKLQFTTEDCKRQSILYNQSSAKCEFFLLVRR